MEKTKKVLYLYEALKNGKEIQIEAFCGEYKISVPTFRRYLSIVRDFLWETHLKEVTFDKIKKVYVIKEWNIKN